MRKLLKVESSNVTKYGHYCNKLVGKSSTSVTTAFGTTESESKETYYLFTGNENQVGFEAELDISLFDLVVKKHAFVDEDNQPQVADLKYLYPKK